MAVVNGNLNVSASFSQTVTAGLVTPQNLGANASQNLPYGNGTGANQIDLIHAKAYSLVASTPQTIDLTSLPDLSGVTVNMARVREILCWITDTALSHTVVLGAAASNPFAAFWGTTGLQTIYPGSAVYRFSDPTSVGSGVGAVTSGTNKSLKIDPGSNNVVFNLVILGCSAVS